MRQKEHGNIVVYLLIAVVLLGGLTFTMSRSNQGESTESQLSQAEAQALAVRILEYKTSMDMAIQNMADYGVDIEDISVMPPTFSGFDSEPPAHITKLFHPAGGGVNFWSMPDSIATDPTLSAFVFSVRNFEWTPTSDPEPVFLARRIKKEVCEELNKMVLGTTEPLTGTNDPAVTANCPDCAEKIAYCLHIPTGDVYFYYHLLEVN
ncbi:MAG: hypothetical protein CMH28_01735 [Micavibrio sp.]|nr:hypothetical protein [Micavibrio sp.]